MILTPDRLLHYLLARGAIEPDAVIDGDLRIVELRRRHRSFQVRRTAGPGLFVKQVQSWDAQTINTLQREGICSRLAQEDPAFAPLNGSVAPFRDYDTARQVLILELFSDAENLMNFHLRQGVFPSDIARKLGRLLGNIHHKIQKVPGDGPAHAAFPRAVPSILQIHQSPDAAWQNYGPAALHLVHLIRQEPELAQALSELADGWRPAALIHGDVKWDNCVRVPAIDPLDESDWELKLIDWELADFGDPDWDAGAVFQAYLAFWIWSLPLDRPPMDKPVALQPLIEQARSPLEVMQPAMQAFWDSYRKARHIPDNQNRTLLRRCLRYCAGRLIQTALELALVSHQANFQMHLLAQLSLNLLNRTDDAIRDLLAM